MDTRRIDSLTLLRKADQHFNYLQVSALKKHIKLPFKLKNACLVLIWCLFHLYRDLQRKKVNFHHITSDLNIPVLPDYMYVPS